MSEVPSACVWQAVAEAPERLWTAGQARGHLTFAIHPAPLLAELSVARNPHRYGFPSAPETDERREKNPQDHTTTVNKPARGKERGREKERTDPRDAEISKSRDARERERRGEKKTPHYLASVTLGEGHDDAILICEDNSGPWHLASNAKAVASRQLSLAFSFVEGRRCEGGTQVDR